jgi:hypothetical protein
MQGKRHTPAVRMANDKLKIKEIKRGSIQNRNQNFEETIFCDLFFAI